MLVGHSTSGNQLICKLLHKILYHDRHFAINFNVYIDKYIDIYLAHRRKYVQRYDSIGCGANVKVFFFFCHFRLFHEEPTKTTTTTTTNIWYINNAYVLLDISKIHYKYMDASTPTNVSLYVLIS